LPGDKSIDPYLLHTKVTMTMFRNNDAYQFFGLSRLWRFRRREEGATVIEYAVLLSLIIGGATIIFYSMDGSTRETLTNLIDGLGGDSWSADQPMSQPRYSSVEMSPMKSSIASQDPERWVQLCGWYAALVACTIILYLLRRMNSKKLTVEPSVDDSMEDIEPQQRHRLFEKRQQIRTILSNDASMLFDSSIGVKHFMSEELVSVRGSKPAVEVTELMEHEGIRHLLVCDASGRLQGIISDRDVKSKQAKKATGLMSHPPIAVTLDTPIGQAITTMLSNRISALPVVDDGIPVGILTATDIMMSFQCVLQLLVRVSREISDPSDPEDADLSTEHDRELVEATA